MTTRNQFEAAQDLRAAGYGIIPYPDGHNPIALIVRQKDRTVTTLPVKDGRVDGEAVAYLISEMAKP